MNFIKHHKHIWIWILPLFLFLGFTIGNSNNNNITILATGDTMLGSWAEMAISDSGYAYPFEHLKSYIDDADIFFTNLEAPFGTSGETFEKQYTFRVKPRLANVLVAGKINLVSLGNNHIMDYGVLSLQETIRALEEHQINYAGAGLNLNQARKPAIMNVKDRQIGFLSYSLTFPEEFWATDTTAGACFPYEEFVFTDVADLSRKTDYVIVSCHWSQELLDTPKKYQRVLAHQLIDKGADLILGHHPHVVQGIEIYKGKLIAYSLGNFIFGSYSEKARESMLLKIILQPEDSMTVQIVPISVYNKEVEFQPRPLLDDEKEAFIQKMIQLSAELNAVPVGISSGGEIKLIKS